MLRSNPERIDDNCMTFNKKTNNKTINKNTHNTIN